MTSSTTRMAVAALLAIGLVSATPAMAHETAKGPHGGPVATVGEQHMHLELTTSGPDIVIYVTDSKDTPLATAGASGKAVVQMGGKTSTVALAPVEGNRLVGKADAPIAKGARVVVSASLPGGVSLQARFVMN